MALWNSGKTVTIYQPNLVTESTYLFKKDKLADSLK